MLYQVHLILLISFLITCSDASASVSRKFSDFDKICRRKAPPGHSEYCDPVKNLHCQPGRDTCRCIDPSSALNLTHVYRWDKQADACVLLRAAYVQDYTKCALRFRNNNGSRNGKRICKLDQECQATALGPYSRCNLENCGCECLAVTHVVLPLDAERNVRNIGGTCFPEKKLGDQCWTELECASIEGGASCRVREHKEPRLRSIVCACDPEKYLPIDGKCVKRLTSLETEACQYDVQCQEIDESAICAVVDDSDDVSGHKVCSCSDGTTLYEGACHVPRGLNESCSTGEECQAALGPGAECSVLPVVEEFGYATHNDTSAEVDEEAVILEEDVRICVCAEGYEYTEINSTGRCADWETAPSYSPVRGPLPPDEDDDMDDLPDGVDGAAPDWIKPTVIICSAFFLTVIATGLLVAYSNWKRLRLLRDIEAASCKQPLLSLKGLGEGVEVGEEDFEIDHDHELGSGRNGIVYGGYFKPRAVQVAVKTNRDGVSSQLYLHAILEEAKVLIHLDKHPNVVQFYGICHQTINKGNIYLFCELCPLGSLEKFLRNNQGSFELSDPGKSPNTRPTSLPDSRPSSEDRSDYRMSLFIAEAASSRPRDSRSSSTSSSGMGTGSKIKIGQLYSWAYQIASAMEFVSARKVIHSDLAARNILLASLDSVRLTDFGLSRRLYESYTYIKTGADPLPWKWLDHDALRFHMFTTETDVWSFGVALWEIWTLGEVPYPGIVSPWCQNFMGRLLEGLHPARPENAGDEIWEIMQKCWSVSKMDRPTFGELKEALGVLVKKFGGRLPGKGGMGDEKSVLDGFGYLLPVEYSK